MSPASPQVGTPFSALSAHRNRIRLKHPLDLWGREGAHEHMACMALAVTMQSWNCNSDAFQG